MVTSQRYFLKKCKCSCSWLWIYNFILVYFFCLVFYPSFMKLLGLGYLSTILSLDASFCFFILWKWLEFQEGDGKSTMSWNWEWLPKNRQEIHWKYINHLLLKSFWYNSNTLCWLLIKMHKTKGFTFVNMILIVFTVLAIDFHMPLPHTTD